MTSTALHDLGVAQLATELRERRVSAVEAAQHFLDRAAPGHAVADHHSRSFAVAVRSFSIRIEGAFTQVFLGLAREHEKAARTHITDCP